MPAEEDSRLPLTRAAEKDQSSPGQLSSIGPAAEPIAVVGMGCRYPGGVAGPDDLWSVVEQARDTLSEFPDDRKWDLDYDPEPGLVGRSYVRESGFLEDVAGFDAAFFGISPREAIAMDPHQRLLLEVTWEALESAGIDPDSLQDSETGVYTGIVHGEYGPRAYQDRDGYAGHLMTGAGCSVAAGRIAYVLGLAGPAISVDTACSSSLVALHLGVRALRAGECSLALAGGASVLALPNYFVGFSALRACAPDGRSKAFADCADGFGPSEGVGVIVLERLTDARRNGHRVLALVRGSAVNQDGASDGLSAPSGIAQQRVIRSALQDAGIGTADVDVVEAHGTGTRLGDFTEAQALLATYGQGRAGEPLWLGSVKSNIGHTMAAAGVAGIIKMIEAMRRDVLPPTLHVDAPTSTVDWTEGAVRLLLEARPWPDAPRPRRAAVSSFGISGTNAHVILEQAPDDEQSSSSADPPTALAWVLSARSSESLARQATRLRDFVQGNPDVHPADVAGALARRTVFEHRAAIVGTDREVLGARLASLAADQPAAGVVTGHPQTAGKTAFVFPGQGSQWVGMGRELLSTCPVFAEQLAMCAAVLTEFVDWDLLAVIRDEPGAPTLDAVEVVQPALFSVFVALAETWRSWGVIPDAVIGHSQGEVAAACVAGLLPLRVAAQIVVLRSRAVAALSGRGGMASVPLSQDQVSQRLTRWGEKLGVAAVNSPEITVVSGAADALEEMLASDEAEGVQSKRIPVDYAAHSSHIDVLETSLRAALGEITATAEASVEFYSTVHGEMVGATALDADYWWRNLRDVVRFDEAVQAAYRQGVRRYLEMSPHPVLTVSVEQNCEVLAARDDQWFVGGSTRRDDGGPTRLLESAAEAWAAGVSVGWADYLGPSGANVDLPTYPFVHTRFWLDPSGPALADAGQLGVRQCGHPLLGAAIEQPGSGEVVFTGRLSLQTHPWLADHVVGDAVLLPGAALVECAVFAGEQVGRGTIQELVLQTPLIVPEDSGVYLRVVVGQQDDIGRAVSVYSRAEGSDGAWTLHAQGVLTETASLAPRAHFAWPPTGAKRVDVSQAYERAADNGYSYGPAFQGISAVWTRGEEVFAEVQLPEQVRDEGFALHPALLDAALQVFSYLGIAAEPGKVLLPFSWEKVQVHALGAKQLRVWLRAAGENRVALELYDQLGEPVATVGALSMRETVLAALNSRSTTIADEALFSLSWVPVDAKPSDADWVEITETPAAGAPIQVLRCPGGGLGDGVTIRQRLWALAECIRAWLTEGSPGESRLVVVTCGAVAVDGSDAVPDLTHAGAWGLLRTVQAEDPGRLLLVDVDDWSCTAAAVRVALAAEEPQAAYRRGALRVPRVTRFDSDAVLDPVPQLSQWSLKTAGRGALTADNLLLQPVQVGELAPTEVRVEVRALGVNFRDVLIALDMYPEPGAAMGCEGAGVVTAVGAAVTGFAPGDRVLGMLPGLLSTADADYRLLARLPDHWNFVEGGSIPAVYLTAYYALRDLADVQPGERILVHTATGGVGMAAVTLAKWWKLEVFATASPEKWPMLRALGIDEDHIASSRDLEFEKKFLDITGHDGVSTVLTSLADEYTDASLRLLPRGGNFLEMGRTNLRDPDAVAADHPGVAYLPFTLPEAGIDRLGEMLRELVVLFAAGEIDPSPISAWDVRRLPEVLRYMSQARHVGKITLPLPRPFDRDGTVLITGGTGGLGALLARHLVTRHEARHLLLVSRSGPNAEGAATLVAELEELGAQVRVVACDVAVRRDLASVLADIPAEHPLTGVIHAAGALRDGLFTDLTFDQFDTVLRAKVDGAFNLHELTADKELALFVLFSSVAGVLGSPGQANYAAANTYLDALAQHRQHLGLPATSLAWGFWGEKTGMTGHLNQQDNTRMSRRGLAPMTSGDGLALFDAALRSGHALLIPSRFSLAKLSDAGDVPHSLRLLARAPRRKAAGNDHGQPRSKFTAQLVGHSPAEQERITLEFVRAQAAAVLGHDSANSVPPDELFRSLGVDSLTGVEFRNRLQTATGLKLSTTIVFDHPTPSKLAQHLRSRIGPEPDTGNGAAPSELADLLTRLEKAARPDDGPLKLDELTRVHLLRRLRVVERSLRGNQIPDTGADLDLADDSEQFAVVETPLQ
jgi:acyl transferase domain-containing protein/NADPH:quinone reductase-like Zn-dependent oxidoreductase